MSNTLFINLINCPSGGALQNACSFLDTAEFHGGTVFITIKGSILENAVSKRGFRYYSVRNNVIAKIVDECLLSRKITCDDVVFSLFGPPILFTSCKSLNIGGMAISNLFHRDVDFWGHLNWFKRKVKLFKDVYRAWRYSKLDYWIFETELLMEMAIKNCGIPSERCCVVMMSPSSLVSPEKAQNSLGEMKIFERHPDKVSLLFLCNAHPNKRLHLVPAILRSLHDLKIPAQAILTTDDNIYYREVLLEAGKLGLCDDIINIGRVAPDSVAHVVYACDIVCNISSLESFSNNCVEAWAMGKPLVITDSAWARRSCMNAAIYIDPNAPEIAAQIIAKTILNDRMTIEVVNNGYDVLKKHPQPKAKSRMYFEIIKEAMTLGKITKQLQKRVKFI